jgi:hypothetical protein
VFHDVPVNDITDTLTVSIQSVNRRNVTSAANAGYIKISPLEADGYTKDGWDIDGYGKDGYTKYGFDLAGYDKDGYNKDGYNKDGYDRAGYDRDGYDKAGRNKMGLTRSEEAAAAAAAAIARAREQRRRNYQNKTLKDIRFGINAGGSIVMTGMKNNVITVTRPDGSTFSVEEPGAEGLTSGAFIGGLEFGLKFWYLEANGIIGPRISGFDFGTGIIGWRYVGGGIGGGVSLLTVSETSVFSPFFNIKFDIGEPKSNKFGIVLRTTFTGRFLPEDENATQEYKEYLTYLLGNFLPCLNFALAFYWK